MKEEVMSVSDYDYALYRINETLKQEDIESKDGIISFYDMVEYAKKGLKKFQYIKGPNSKLAKELNSSNPINSLINNYHTDINILDGKKSVIKIYSNFSLEEITLTKNINSSLIAIEPSTQKTQQICKKHYNTIMESFSILENHIKFFNGLLHREHCYIHTYAPDCFYFVKLYYNDFGQMKTKIELLHKYNTEQSYIGRKALKEILEKNKNELLKKFPIDLNRDLENVGGKHMLLLAKYQYFKEQENEKQAIKKKVLK